MVRRIFFIQYLFILAFICRAQVITVSSFKLLETDLTANTVGTIETDQNGETAALIKVVTTQTGFFFDGGALGIVKTKQTPGEVWVYIPRGSKKISIKHPQLGVLRDYYFPITIEAARTYEMTLITGEVQTVIKQSRTSQYVVFQLTPENAVVELNGELLKTDGGTAMKMMKFGTYDYRVQAPDYLPEAGKVTIDDPNNKIIVNISLKPNYSNVTFIVANDAEIWVNGEKKGVGLWTGNLGAGTYEIETKKDGHRSINVTKDIVVTEEPQTIELQTPIPIYGEADISSSPAMADIYIDGIKVGQTPQIVSNLLIGEHEIQINKNGYDLYSSKVVIKEKETITLSAILGKSQDISIFTINNIPFKMVLVEGGTFQMGEGHGKHKVTLTSYYIGETEVTHELWKAVMGNIPTGSINRGDNQPVNCISWFDCQRFVKELNKITGHEFRLPTEAEWEFAACGGLKSKSYVYSGSNDIGEVGWYSRGNTWNVKQLKANELGLYDMSGNLWEWCQDWYDSYLITNQTNPHGPTTGSERVYRGGSYNLPKEYQKVTYRNSATPNYSTPTIGLRLALSVGD